MHDREEAGIIAQRLTDGYGIERILGQKMDVLKTLEGVTDYTVAVILCLKEASQRKPK